MALGLFRPETLPAPQVLRQRHLALVLVDECLGGQRSDTRCFRVQVSSAGGELLLYENGSGDEYGLVLDGNDAVLWFFDHECPYSPWALEGEPRDWPGMLAGLPPRLAAHLPAPEYGPRSISACYWHTNGQWHMGTPEPATDAPAPLLSDPQGVGDLIKPLLDVDAPTVALLVVDYHEAPDRLDAATDLIQLVESGSPVTAAALDPIRPVDGVAAMVQRSQAITGDSPPPPLQ